MSAASMPRGFANYIAFVRVIFFVLSLGMIALNAWFLYYVDQLEKRGCKCAFGWRRQVMEGSLALFIIMSIVSLFVDWAGHFPLLSILYMAVLFMYIVVARGFISQMKETHCECAETDAFRVLDVVNWIQLYFVAVVVLAIVLKVAYLITVGRGSVSAVSRRR
jgi:hypothetical protein